MSCICVVFEKQIVLRTKRLMRVRKVRCLRSIFWVFRLPGQLSLSRFMVYGMMRLWHHDTVTGGTTHGPSTVCRCAVSPDGVSGFHQPDPRRVSPARSIL